MPRFDSADREQRGTQTSGRGLMEGVEEPLFNLFAGTRPSPWTNSKGQAVDSGGSPLAQVLPQPGLGGLAPGPNSLPPGPWTVPELAAGDAATRSALSAGTLRAPWEGDPLPVAPPVEAPARRPVGGRSPAPAAAPMPAGPSDARKALDAKNGADLEVAKAERQQQSLDAMDELSAIQQGEQKRQVAEAESAKLLTDIQKSTDDLAKMVPDRNRWWSTRTTGQRFAAVAASALNTINNGMFDAKSENPILRFIDQDVQDQREARDAKRAGVQDKIGLYKMFRDRGIGDAAATTAAKLEMIRAAKGIVSDQVGAARDKQMQANGQAALAKLDAAEKETAMQLQEHVDKHGESQAEQALKWAQIKQLSMKPMAGGPNDPLTRGIGGEQLRFKDEREAREFDEAMTAAAVHSDALDKVLEHGAKPGFMAALARMTGIGSDVAAATTARDDVSGVSNAAKGIRTALTAPQIERLNHALSAGWNENTARAAVEVEREGVRKGLERQLINQGMTPARAAAAVRKALAEGRVDFQRK